MRKKYIFIDISKFNDILTNYAINYQILFVLTKNSLPSIGSSRAYPLPLR